MPTAPQAEYAPRQDLSQRVTSESQSHTLHGNLEERPVGDVERESLVPPEPGVVLKGLIHRRGSSGKEGAHLCSVRRLVVRREPDEMTRSLDRLRALVLRRERVAEVPEPLRRLKAQGSKLRALVVEVVLEAGGPVQQSALSVISAQRPL